MAPALLQSVGNHGMFGEGEIVPFRLPSSKNVWTKPDPRLDLCAASPSGWADEIDKIRNEGIASHVGLEQVIMESAHKEIR